VDLLAGYVEEAEVYRDGITSTTALYEGMLAGLDILRTFPANEPRFLVVFSDGNHHMALGECVARFLAAYPDAGDVFYTTTPPGPPVAHTPRASP